jgi:prolyl-tRNA synthetase
VDLVLADDVTVTKVTGAEVGFAGPLGFVIDDGKAYRIRVIADETVRGMCNFLCGTNETNYHCLDVNLGRDLPEPEYFDLRLAQAGESCPSCGKSLSAGHGIKVGYLAKPGTGYSTVLDATFRDQQGKLCAFFMGCYQVDVSRIACAVVEQHHDERGICWPLTLSPYHVHIVALKVAKEDIRRVSERLYEDLWSAGIEVLYDDRRGVTPGVKFADADLIGAPWRINVGRTASEGKVEVKERKTGEAMTLPVDDIVEWLKQKCQTKK